ncbi:Phophatidylserine decarboxylase-domain-containing protein [Aspergillus avenaceus]|uniref:Phophatidylserine decarboxylase-domain-containing protein n=1 Tax=Aspergillus avenaceus TaxID=36643 RepID=A0A5N6TKH1_ASPAV|nr:Phophatidylserine decarboxylase-domain-containing protein [Aspergillus avenaceus]
MAGVLRDFEQLIETEPGLKDLADGMFNEVPQNSYYDWDPSHRYARVQGYQHMLRLFNEVLVTAPTWNAGAAAAGMAGAPFNAILAWPMATASGQAFFLNKKVNKAIQKVLKEWGRFLQTEDSAEAIDSWLENVAADDKNPFEQLYLCDPNKPHHGFSSWDAFFTREFRDGVRPLAAPDDGPPFLLPTTDTPVDPTAVIISPCESVTYWRSTSVQARDTFWLKGQPYSLSEMLDHDALASRFTNGTVHQSWVEAESYHRWHAPVSGTIVKTATIRGSYFAQLPAAGFPDPDPTGQNFSLRYLTSVATRSLVFIEADNPDIGLMCFVAVSMMEVSSCEVIVKAGQYVRKGDQIGMFHFGGSTQCLVFRPGVELDWVPEACPPFCGDYCGEPKMILVNSWLACVRKPEMWVDAEGCVVVERAGLAP